MPLLGWPKSGWPEEMVIFPPMVALVIFTDVIVLEDLKDGDYKIYFGDDANKDSKFDVGAPTTNVHLTIPCP